MVCGGARGEEPLGKLVCHRCSVREEVGLGTGRGQSSSCHGSSRTVVQRSAPDAAPRRQRWPDAVPGRNRFSAAERYLARVTHVPPTYVGRAARHRRGRPRAAHPGRRLRRGVRPGRQQRHRRRLLAAGRQRRHRRASYRIRNRYDLATQRLEGRTVLELTATERPEQLPPRLPAADDEGDRRRRAGRRTRGPTSTSSGSPPTRRWSRAPPTGSWSTTPATPTGRSTPASATGWPTTARSWR